jgi:hypothetical protein
MRVTVTNLSAVSFALAALGSALLTVARLVRRHLGGPGKRVL